MSLLLRCAVLGCPQYASSSMIFPNVFINHPKASNATNYSSKQGTYAPPNPPDPDAIFEGGIRLMFVWTNFLTVVLHYMFLSISKNLPAHIKSLPSAFIQPPWVLNEWSVISPNRESISSSTVNDEGSIL